MKTNGPMSTEAVRRLLAGIEKGASDDERAARLVSRSCRHSPA